MSVSYCSSLKQFQFTEDCESELQQNKLSMRLETYTKYICFVLTPGFQTMSYIKVSMYKL
jgi:hypothetical protein